MMYPLWKGATSDDPKLEDSPLVFWKQPGVHAPNTKVSEDNAVKIETPEHLSEGDIVWVRLAYSYVVMEKKPQKMGYGSRT